MKPPNELGQKAYPKIPHLPGSRTGSSDKVAPRPLARRCTQQGEPGDTVVVQEKLDGSCVAVLLKQGEVIALGREGWRAALSQNPGRQMFSRWVGVHAARFDQVLREGEWLVGEWLALAHSTRYRLSHEPFVAFDLFSAGAALSTPALEDRLGDRFARPHLLHSGAAVEIEVIDARLGELGHHGALDRAEGAMWRVERGGVVVTRAKYVRPGKTDGALLPENSGQPAVWNWTDQPVASVTTSG
ncbi:MAG: RNA ligase family protein [Archangium sp.]|nr:RNA ligase family protein [Archangium sp.]